MTSLVRLIRDHGDAVEAALAYRGIDLLDLYRGRMSLRRLFLLIRYLPPDDVLWKAIDMADQETRTRAFQERLKARRDHYQPKG